MSKEYYEYLHDNTRTYVEGVLTEVRERIGGGDKYGEAMRNS